MHKHKEYYVSKLTIDLQKLIPQKPVDFKDKSQTIFYRYQTESAINEDDIYNLYNVLTLIYRY